MMWYVWEYLKKRVQKRLAGNLFFFQETSIEKKRIILYNERKHYQEHLFFQITRKNPVILFFKHGNEYVIKNFEVCIFLFFIFLG